MRRRFAVAFTLATLIAPTATPAAAADSMAIMQEAIAINGRDGLDAALEYLRDQIETNKATATPDPAMAAVYSMLAEAILGQGDAVEALRLVDEGLALARSVPEPDPETVADLTGDRGSILEAMGDREGAIAATIESIALFDKTFGKIPDTNTIRFRLANFLEAGNRWEEALPYRRDLVDLLTAAGTDPDGLVASWRALVFNLRTTGRIDEAVEVNRKFVAAVDALRPADHPDRPFAMNYLAATLLQAERTEDAIAVLKDTLPLAEAIADPQSVLKAQVKNNLGSAFRRLNRLEEAEPFLREADAEWEKLGPSQQIMRASTLNQLTEVLSGLGRNDEALAFSDTAIGLTAGHEDFTSGIPLEVLDNRAMLLALAQRYAEAVDITRRSLAGWLKIRPPDSQQVIIAHQNLAAILADVGAYDEAGREMDAAIASADRTLDRQGVTYALLLATRGALRGNIGAFEASASDYEGALAIWHREGPGSAREARAIGNLAMAKNRLGADSESEALMRRAIAIYEAVAPAHADLDNIYSNLVALLRDQGRFAESTALGRKFLARAEAIGEDRLATATALYDLAFSLYMERQSAEAEPLLLRALEIQRRHLPAKHTTIANTLSNLSLVLWELERIEESGDRAIEALQMREAVLPATHPNIAISLGVVALFLDTAGRFSEAEDYYRRAMAIAEKAYGQNHPDYIHPASRLAAMLAGKAGRPAEALPLFRQIAASIAMNAESEATMAADIDKRLATDRSVFGSYVQAAWTASAIGR